MGNALLRRLKTSFDRDISATKEMTQTQSDVLVQRIDDQHNELLRKIDELDRQVTELLEVWVGVAQAEEVVAKEK